jgi:hypothetical protein
MSFLWNFVASVVFPLLVSEESEVVALFIIIIIIIDLVIFWGVV